ncbi:MAG: ribosome silencing factor [Cellulomonadaceae bacterium]|jgi:ribosome-associated protein|nr:ribosome silencing factor [Cellulomonadaceae bacterium]
MTATARSVTLAGVAALAAANLKAKEIIALDVSDQLVLTDVFVLAAGDSERQVGAIVDAVEEAMYLNGAKPVRREGKNAGRWVLLDFGDVVVHVQHEEDRVYYALERLWRDCPVVPLPEEVYAADPDAHITRAITI